MANVIDLRRRPTVNMFSTKTSLFITAALFACLSYGHIPSGSEDPVRLVRQATENDTDDFVELSVGDEVFANFTVVDDQPGTFKIKSSDERVFAVELVDDGDDKVVSVNETVQVKITGEFLGIEQLRFVDPEDEDLVFASYKIRVKRVPSIISTIFTVTLLIWLVISYVSMGALMDWPTLKERLYPPWPIIIGMVCQFILMPLVTFVLANILPVDNPTAVGIVLVGTCPGGWLSNIFSVLLDVDFILSVTMTFFSSIAGMAMMPFNIFVYATPFIQDNRNLQTPFGDLALNLIVLVVACIIGIFLGWKFEKFRTFCEKVLKPIAVVLIVFGLGLGIPADIHMFYSEWPIWVAAFTTPLVGAYLGLSLSRIFALPVRKSVTIALETGVQNALLARTVVYLYYPQPEGDLVGRVQTLTVLITLIEGCIISISYQLARFIFCRGEKDDEVELKGAEDGEKKVEANGNDKTEDGKSGGVANPAFDDSKTVV